RQDDPLAYLADPVFLLYMLLLLGGVGLAVCRRLWLLLAPILSSVLLLPLVNRDYQFEIHTRYIGFLLPLGAILLALPCAALIAGGRRLPRRAWAAVLPAGAAPGL